jgi:hypothetical protein
MLIKSLLPDLLVRVVLVDTALMLELILDLLKLPSVLLFPSTAVFLEL